jgi:hypothetical protein
MLSQVFRADMDFVLYADNVQTIGISIILNIKISMITSLQQLVDQPVVVVLYRSGSSGEFVSWALSQTIQQFCKASMNWATSNRCIFEDFFQRSLHCGPVTDEVIIPRVNHYLEKFGSGGSWYMGMSHQRPEHLDFLSQWATQWPIIEITTGQQVSKKFQNLARHQKLNSQQKDPRSMCQITFPRHLRVEWTDLLLDDVENAYRKIVDFLGAQGDFEQFRLLLDDYLNKNQSLIQQAHES